MIFVMMREIKTDQRSVYDLNIIKLNQYVFDMIASKADDKAEQWPGHQGDSTQAAPGLVQYDGALPLHTPICKIKSINRKK